MGLQWPFASVARLSLDVGREGYSLACPSNTVYG